MNKILFSTIRCVGVVSMSLACTVPVLAQSLIINLLWHQCWKQLVH